MQKIKTYNQVSGKSIQRIEFLSDGVFAIALTILVLDIKVPASENVASEKGLITLFEMLAPKLLTYFLSFITLGIFWTAHTSQFYFFEKSDRKLNWLNLFFLMFVTIIPFTTAFLSEFITFKFAIALYWLNLFLLGIMLFMILNYADKKNYFKPGIAEKTAIIQAMNRRGKIAQTLYAAGSLLCFISTYLSIIVLIAIQLYFALALFTKSTIRSDQKRS